MLRLVKFIFFFILSVGLPGTHALAEDYKINSGIAGTITTVGSDTMSTLLSVWAEEFEELYPQVNFQMQAAGSSTAPPAMVQGTANIGPMSRELKALEKQAFIAKYGYEPILVPVALDAIILFVDLENPVKKLSQSQIDAMFSITRFCGGETSLESWAQIPASNSYPYRIRMFGRSAVSGTYGLFKSNVLCDGDFKPGVAELPSSSSIVQTVAFFKGAIGYAAWGFQYSGVKILAVSNNASTNKASAVAVMPSEQSISDREYPFTRTLYLMVNKAPDNALDNPVLEYIRFIFSLQGNELTRREGYVPLSARQQKTIINSLY